jgi:hypothetical protein
MIRKGVRSCKHEEVVTTKITMTITTKKGVLEAILNYKIVAMKTKLITTKKSRVARRFLITRYL